MEIEVKNLNEAKKYMKDNIPYDKCYEHKKGVWYFCQSNPNLPKHIIGKVLATYFEGDKLYIEN